MTDYLKRNLKFTCLFVSIGLVTGVLYSVMVSVFGSVHPFRPELPVLFVIFSGMMLLVVEIIKEIIKARRYNPDQIEQEFNVPVFGTIPWLEKEVYDEPDIMFAIDETASFYSLAFQKAVSRLKLKGLRSNKKVFAFTSTEFSKHRSTIIMNIAYSLSRTGESVIVVDGDFRTPSISNDLGLKMENRGDLTELLANFPDEINKYIYSISGVKNFFIIPNNGNSSDPSLYLYSEAFRRLIKELKLRYSWVFIDVPPALAVPDTFMVGPCIDGVILMTGVETNKSVLKTIYKQLRAYDIDIFGIITREFQTKEVVSDNAYIKQMISQMMAQNHDLIAE